jgi:hypothetical protein
VGAVLVFYDVSEERRLSEEIHYVGRDSEQFPTRHVGETPKGVRYLADDADPHAPNCAFILVARFAPHLWATRLAAGSIVNIGWPIGAVLIVGTWCSMGLYVRHANCEIDELAALIPAGAIS